MAADGLELKPRVVAATRDSPRVDRGEHEKSKRRLQVRRVTPASIMVPDVHKRVLAMVDRLEDVLMRDAECGRESLREVLEGEPIKLKPDESRGYLVAEYTLGVRALLPADTVVAGAGFDTYLMRIPRAKTKT